MARDRIQRRVDLLLDEADQAVAQSDWSVVRDRAQNVLALGPGNGDAATFLAAADRAIANYNAPPSPDGQPLTSLPTPTTNATAPYQPSPFANGRSEAKRFLGEGGKKRVYLAQDTLLDQKVARPSWTSPWPFPESWACGP